MEEVDNIEELQQAFLDYIEEVKKLPLIDKKKEVVDNIKELIAAIDYLAQEEGMQLHYLTSKEVLDINNENMPEEEYVEALLVYIENAKNMIGEYLINKTNKKE